MPLCTLSTFIVSEINKPQWQVSVIGTKLMFKDTTVHTMLAWKVRMPLLPVAGQLETVEMETANGKQKRSKLDANES